MTAATSKLRQAAGRGRSVRFQAQPLFAIARRFRLTSGAPTGHAAAALVNLITASRPSQGSLGHLPIDLDQGWRRNGVYRRLALPQRAGPGLAPPTPPSEVGTIFALWRSASRARVRPMRRISRFGMVLVRREEEPRAVEDLARVEKFFARNAVLRPEPDCRPRRASSSYRPLRSMPAASLAIRAAGIALPPSVRDASA
jgi:hypothetical protein